MNETKVMVDFRYPADGCQTVMLTGSFLRWKDQLPLQKEVESNEFRLTIPLPVGIHHYKYIVDGEWTVLSTEPTMKDLDGNENNCIAVRRPMRKQSTCTLASCIFPPRSLLTSSLPLCSTNSL